MPIEGAFVIGLEKREDSRGFFARAFCANEFDAHGLATHFVQGNLSLSERKGCIRGLHYQVPPSTEAKLLRCIRGATHHVLVDMRPSSPTHGRHCAVELTPTGRQALYVPEVCATGYQALVDSSEIMYLVSGFYDPDQERGIRYDDPALGISWPLPVSDISEKDLSWPSVTIDGVRTT